MKKTALFTSLLLSVVSLTQVQENFTDTDLHSNPSWHGDHGSVSINSNEQLQSLASGAGKIQFMTDNLWQPQNSFEWRFWLKQHFSGSSSNFGRIYLFLKDSTDLLSDAIYMEFGESGSNDAMHFIEQKNGTKTTLFSGSPGEISSAFVHRYRCVRESIGRWKIWRDDLGNNSFTFLGSFQDDLNNLSGSTGIRWQFTSSNAQKFYFDDFYCGVEIIDSEPPTITVVEVEGPQNILLEFSEDIDSASIPLCNFQIDGKNTSYNATPLDHNKLSFYLVDSLSNNFSYTFSISNISDSSGNSMSDTSCYFVVRYHEQPEYGDIILTEIMADPSPSQGLPETEYIEIFNRSLRVFSASKLKIADLSDTVLLDNTWILPGEAYIFGPSGISDSIVGSHDISSFPNLNNSADRIMLLDENNQLLDSITYSKSTYRDKDKDDGGYSLNRYDLSKKCSDGGNWGVLVSGANGNPGKIVETPMNQSFVLKETVQHASSVFELQFNQYLDSSSIKNMDITISGSIKDTLIYCPSRFSKSIFLFFNDALPLSTPYQIELQNIGSCEGQLEIAHIELIRPEKPLKDDILFNEVLFYPSTGGADFVELINASSKYLDLEGCQIIRVKEDDLDIADPFPTTILRPLGITAITENTEALSTFYTIGQTLEFDLPSLPSDSASIFLSCQSTIIDSMHYDEAYHFKLLDSPRGKSLERISINRQSLDKSNWYTCSEKQAWATPGRSNSMIDPESILPEIGLLNQSISPDNDGYEDLLMLSYAFDESHFSFLVSIYDLNGMLIFKEKDLYIAERSGVYTWDGVTDWGQKASIGPYILVMEILNLERGSKFALKLPFVVAGKL